MDILTEDSYIRRNLDRIRGLMEDARTSAQEDGGNDGRKGAIAITDDPMFGQNVLTNQIEQFRSIVDSGAQFAKVDGENVSECPLIYIPRTGNLVFSGIIPSMNGLKFQLVLKTSTGNGCFIWGDGVILSRENLQTLTKLFGFYQNWKEEWQTESGDLERMAQHYAES